MRVESQLVKILKTGCDEEICSSLSKFRLRETLLPPLVPGHVITVTLRTIWSWAQEERCDGGDSQQIPPLHALWATPSLDRGSQEKYYCVKKNLQITPTVFKLQKWFLHQNGVESGIIVGQSERRGELKKIVERTEFKKSLMSTKKQLVVVAKQKQRN